MEKPTYPKKESTLGKEQVESERILNSKIEVVKDGTGRIKSVMIIEGDKKIDLYEFLPIGTVFIANDQANYLFWPGDPKSKNHPPMVEFPVQEVNSINGRLGILHEIGEAICASKCNYPDWYFSNNIIRTIEVTIKFIWRRLEYRRLKKQASKDNYLRKEFWKEMESGPSFKYSREIILATIRKLARKERDAWAEALKVYRRIKSEKGIDILGGVKSESITKALEGDLASYHLAYGILVPEYQGTLFLNKKPSQ